MRAIQRRLQCTVLHSSESAPVVAFKQAFSKGDSAAQHRHEVASLQSLSYQRLSFIEPQRPYRRDTFVCPQRGVYLLSFSIQCVIAAFGGVAFRMVREAACLPGTPFGSRSNECRVRGSGCLLGSECHLDNPLCSARLRSMNAQCLASLVEGDTLSVEYALYALTKHASIAQCSVREGALLILGPLMFADAYVCAEVPLYNQGRQICSVPFAIPTLTPKTSSEWSCLASGRYNGAIRLTYNGSTFPSDERGFFVACVLRHANSEEVTIPGTSVYPFGSEPKICQESMGNLADRSAVNCFMIHVPFLVTMQKYDRIVLRFVSSLPRHQSQQNLAYCLLARQSLLWIAQCHTSFPLLLTITRPERLPAGMSATSQPSRVLPFVATRFDSQPPQWGLRTHSNDSPEYCCKASGYYNVAYFLTLRQQPSTIDVGNGVEFAVNGEPCSWSCTSVLGSPARSCGQTFVTVHVTACFRVCLQEGDVVSMITTNTDLLVERGTCVLIGPYHRQNDQEKQEWNTHFVDDRDYLPALLG